MENTAQRRVYRDIHTAQGPSRMLYDFRDTHPKFSYTQCCFMCYIVFPGCLARGDIEPVQILVIRISVGI